MKLSTTLHLATGITASTLPDWVRNFDQQTLALEEAAESSWLALDSLVSEVRHGFETLVDGIDFDVNDLFSSSAFVEDEDDFDPTSLFDDLDLGRPRHGGKHNLTIYELISAAKFASNFSSLLDDQANLVKLLNSTDTNSTVFVPINKAFKNIPQGGKKPPAEFLEKVLQYHVGDDAYYGRDLFPRHTIPTVLKEKLLGGEPQRLRIRAGFLGTRVNFYSRVVAANVGAKNGVIHFVNHILVPPPFAGQLLSLFPDTFSTLLLAYEKTDFVDKVAHRMKTVGATVFAPSNSAFRRLGPRANAFLFNTPKGLKCLEALLKYQIAPNVTLYSDAKYTAPDAETEKPGSTEYIELESLLEGKSLHVHIKKWHGIITGVSVNRFVKVSVQDGVAKNGVVHVVDRVPIPPHKHNKPGEGEDLEEISPEELEKRLAPYLDEEAGVAMGEL